MASWRELAKQVPQAYQATASQGIDTSTINNFLKGTDAAKNLLKVADFDAYRKTEKEDDRMGFLQRLGEALSFDEWSDDVVWALDKFHDDSGKTTPLKGIAASTVGLLPHYIQTGVGKLAGSITGSKDLASYEGPRGKDVIPQIIAMTKMGTPQGQALMAKKGGKLDYTDFESIMQSGGMTQGAQSAAKIASGAVGLAADIITPTLFVTSAAGSAAKKAATARKVIRQGVKKAKAPTFEMLIKNSPKDALKVAKEALGSAGLEVSKKNITKLFKEGDTFLKSSIKKTTKGGLYFTKPFSGSSKILKEGAKLDTVAKYLDNPIAAVFGDTKKILGGIPVEGGEKTLGNWVTEINDDVVKKHFQQGFIFKKSSEKLSKNVDKLTSDLASAKFKTSISEMEAEKALQKMSELKELPDGLQPENLATMKEYLTGNISYTDLNGYLRNAPISVKDKARIAKVFDKIESGTTKATTKVVEPTYKDVADMIDLGVKPEMAEVAVFEPKRYKLAVENSFQLGVAKKKVKQIRNGIKQGMIREEANKRVEKILKSNYGNPKYYTKEIAEDASGIPMTTYTPKFKNKALISREWSTAAKKVNAEIKKDPSMLNENLDKAVRSSMGVRLKAVKDSADPLLPAFEIYNPKGFTLDEVKGDIGDISRQLESKYGMGASVDEMYSAVSKEYNQFKNAGYREGLEELEKQLIYLEWRKDYGFTTLQAVANGEKFETISSLLRETTRPYRVSVSRLEGTPTGKPGVISKGADVIRKEERAIEFLNEDIGKTISVTERKPRATWQDFLKRESILMKEENAQKYQKLVEDEFTKNIYIENGQLKTVEDRVKAMDEAQKVYKQAIKDSTKAAPVTSPAEEVISSSYLNRSTKIEKMTPEEISQFDTMLKQVKGGEKGRKRLVDGIYAYQEVANNAKGYAKDFQKWLLSAPLAQEDKKQIGSMLNQVFDYYGKDFSKPEEVKGVLNTLYQLRARINEVGKMDARSKTIADYFDQVLVKPMEDQAKTYLLRKKWWPESAGMGIVGYSHKSMDTPNMNFPEVSRIMDRKERAIANDAMMSAYNDVLGKGEVFKTKNRLDTLVEDMVGVQARQNSKIFTVHKNMCDLLNLVTSGEAGDLIKKIPEGGKVNMESWVKITDIPVLKESNIWAHKDVAKGLQSLVNFYSKEEGPEIFQHLSAFNNVWKALQTGAGVDLPKIRGGAAVKLHEVGMGKFVDFYNNDLSNIPLSPGFTARNFTTNIADLYIVGGMKPKEMPGYLNKAIDVIRAMKKGIGSEETNLGIFGLSKSKSIPSQVSTWLKESIDGGLWGTSYKTSEWMGGGGEGVTSKMLKAMTESRSLDYNQNIEMMNKIALFIYEREGGKTLSEAVSSVDRALFDYAKVTATERDIIKPLTVFYTWTKRNIQLMLEIATGTGDFKGDPSAARRLRLLSKLVLEPGRQLSTTSGQEQAMLPEWTQNTAGMSFKNSQGEANLVSGYGVNVEALSDWLNGPKSAFNSALDMLAPTYKVPLNLLGTGVNTFKGVPIEKDTSAYAYRSLPQPLKDLLGVKEKKWVDRNGKEGVTYTMDGSKKYVLESFLGRGVSVPAKLFSVASGDTPALKGLGGMVTGVNNSTYDLSYLKYKAEKEEREKIMQELERLGLVSSYSGYGANTQGIEMNSPEAYEYLKLLLNNNDYTNE